MVYILLANGFEEAEALVPADLLRRAGIETALVSLKEDTVVGGHGIAVKTDMTLDQVRLTGEDMVVLPGGAQGYRNLGACVEVEDLVRAADLRGSWLAAICAAPTLLGRWGLLEGRRAVCYPGMEAQLTGAVVCGDADVVRDGRLITARAAGAATAFGLKLVAVLAGEEKAREVAHGIYYC